MSTQLGEGARASRRSIPAKSYQVFNERTLDRIPQVAELPAEQQFNIRVVSQVLPFRVNQHVVDSLIRWEDVPSDPLFRLVFPQREMLEEEHFDRVADLLRRGAEREEVKSVAEEIQRELNPHPGGQMTLNVPRVGNEYLWGAQHKYRETLLFFPTQGQTCHAYCSFCFRWAQFVDNREFRMASREVATLHEYLSSHEEISDLLVTGGDPLVMRTPLLEQYLRPLLGEEFAHVQSIRLGTKAITFWPYRFVTDPDADALLRLLEELVDAGKHVAVMAHFEHGREFANEVAEEAIRRIRETGAIIRTQAPVLRNINNDAGVWASMWDAQVRQGMVPYYMFVERDTGARRYFELPLERTWDVYRDAVQQVSGLGRTVRGPVMSATPGKVEIQGVTEVSGERVFVLRLLQARKPECTNRPFFARYDPQATWFDQLRPAFGASKFFFED